MKREDVSSRVNLVEVTISTESLESCKTMAFRLAMKASDDLTVLDPSHTHILIEKESAKETRI